MPRAGGSTGSTSPSTGSNSLWGSGGMAAPPVAPPIDNPAAPPTPTPAAGPSAGVESIDPTNPIGLGESIQKDVTANQSLWGGLADAVFGANGQGGLPIISNVAHAVGGALQGTFGQNDGSLLGGTPIGAAARFLGGVPGGAGDVVNNIAGAAGQGAETIGEGNNDAVNQFNALPDSAAKAAAQQQMASTPALGGHIAFDYLKQFQIANQEGLGNPDNAKYYPAGATRDQYPGKPQIAPELATPGSLADDISNFITGIGMTTRPVERLVAGAAAPAGFLGAQGLNRWQQIEAIGDSNGKLGYSGTSGSGGLSPTEQLAYQNVKDSLWSPDQALTFLAASGGGYSHNALLELPAEVLLDPQVWGSVGAAGLAKLGGLGIRLAASDAGTLIRSAVTPDIALSNAARDAGLTVSRDEAGSLINAASDVMKSEKAPGLTALSDDGFLQAAKSVPALADATPDTVKSLLTAAASGQELSRVNVLGHLAQNQVVSDAMRAIGGHVFAPIEDSALGTAAKVVRTIIDPFHAIGEGTLKGEAGVDVTAEMATRAMDVAHGPLAAAQVTNDMKAVDPEVAAAINDAKATYSANVSRLVLLRQHVAATLFGGLGHTVIGHSPEEFVDALLKNAPKDFATNLQDAMVKVRQMVWDGPARSNLGERMAAMYGKMSPGEWTTYLAGKSNDYLSILHAATYGTATKNFLTAVGHAAIELGTAGAKAAKLDRLILLNRTTLTDLGAQGILQRISVDGMAALAKEDGFDNVLEWVTSQGFRSVQDYVVAEIREAQTLYPELSYVKLAPEAIDRSIQQFTSRLTRALGDEILPHQLNDVEIAKLPQVMGDLRDTMHEAFTYGFRPTDDKLMGITWDTSGNFVAGFDPWADHVAESAPAARGIQGVLHNAAGMPVIGTSFGRALDYLDAGAKTLTARVSGAMIVDSAKQRFISAAVQAHAELTSQEAARIFESISEAAQVRKIAVRGLSATNMWEAADAIVPDVLRQSGAMTQRSLMQMVVKAYEGDLRFVGLTQAFTGKAKTLFSLTGNNFAGQMAEDLYQKIRFGPLSVFSVQRRVESIVLNAARGISPSLGTKFTQADREAAAIYNKLQETGVMGATFAADQAEYNAQALLGTNMQDVLGRMAEPSRWQQLTDVSGATRLAELKTFQANLGPTLRKVFDDTMPGEWDRMIQAATDQAGHLVSDEDFARQYVLEQAFGSDVRVNNIIAPGENYADFTHAISTQAWHQPANLSELTGLNLDFMARGMGFPKLTGGVVHDEATLRAALADPASGVTMNRVTDLLDNMGAHPDYIRRVDNALNFHWDGFWRTVQDTYDLSGTETTRLKTMFTRAAEVRGFASPTDYVSQLWSPLVAGGQEAGIHAMDSAVSVLRAPKDASEDDLLNQVADVFRTHLDPSGQDTLMQAFEKDLPSEVQRAMDEGRTTDSQQLQGVLNQFRGSPTGDILPQYAVSPDGFQRGRIVSQKTYDATRLQGGALLDQASAKAATPFVPLTDANTDELFTRLEANDGATFDPHSGQFIDESTHATPPAGPYISAIGMGSSIPAAGVDADKFRAGLATFMADNRSELEKADHYVGVFRNPDTGLIEYDVTIPLSTSQDAEAVQAAVPGSAGAYNLSRQVEPTGGFATRAANQGVQEVRDVAAGYMRKVGLPVPERRYFGLDQDFSERTAKAYDAMPNAAPAVARKTPVTLRSLQRASTRLKRTAGVDADTRRAYQAFVDETKQQYDAIRASGVNIVPVQENPYRNSAEMMADVSQNHTLKVFAGSAEHPLMTDEQNVMFRGVHDYFAHAAEGFQFGPQGELNAAIKHSQMYSPEARRAMLTETHGQNSFVNFSDKATESGETVSAVNKANPGTIYAEQKAGVLPQDIIDEFNREFVGGPVAHPDVFPPVSVGDWKAAHTQALTGAIRDSMSRAAGVATGRVVNPDVERAVQQFSKWSQSALKDGLLRDDPQYEALLNKVTGIPTNNAVPYNQMQQLVTGRVAQALKDASADAFRLHYFNQSRTFLERSLNHPFFGLYPASYMWGKVLPEVARFMSHAPFGLETGAALKGMTDIRQAIATQAEYDPNFTKELDKLGSSGLAFAIGYLMPSVPWDIGASYPSWMRNLAAQGNANQALVDAGKPPKPIDLTSNYGPIANIGDYISPLRPVGQIERPLGDIGKLLGNGKPVKPVAAPAPQSPTDAPVGVNDLAPLLQDNVQQLRAILGGQ